MMTDVRRQKVQDPCVQNSWSRIFSRLELRAAFASCSVPFVISYIVSPRAHLCKVKHCSHEQCLFVCSCLCIHVYELKMQIEFCSRHPLHRVASALTFVRSNCTRATSDSSLQRLHSTKSFESFRIQEVPAECSRVF